jgi:uncharacterized Rmd1/YagE family protein
MQSSFELNAYHFSKRIHLKNVSLGDQLKIRLHTPYELILEKGNDQFILLYNFGSIVFVNLQKAEKDELLKTLSSVFALNLNAFKYDDYTIEINTDSPVAHRLDFNKLVTQKFDFEAIRVMALLVGQSVALDYYQSVTVDLLADTKDISEELRIHGKSSRNIKSLVKYMGACMSTKQSLTDDLYIYDEPDETWDNQNLSKLFEEARRHLEIQSRFKSIYYDLDLIQQSSEMVADLIQIRKQNVLELTIIGLIAFEVVWALADKFT